MKLLLGLTIAALGHVDAAPALRSVARRGASTVARATTTNMPARAAQPITPAKTAGMSTLVGEI